MTIPNDAFANCDDVDAEYFDEEPPDPFPDDPNYAEFLQARARLERESRRVFRYPKIQQDAPTRRRPLRNGTRCFIRRLGQRMHHRAPRSPRVARRASSGVGNETDGEPWPQSCGLSRDKNKRELGSEPQHLDFTRSLFARAP